ncbi:MAG TPA: hypothetical protein PLG59_16650, partial [bacterium]|nr:hypothetical protein [bacterium]
ARYLDVQLINDFVPESPGDQAVMNGMSGIWRAGDENLAASTVTSLGNNQYRLSRLLRGIRGSEHAADDHVIGECVVCLDSAIFIPLEMSDYNTTLLFKISAAGADHLDDIPPVAHAYEGENYLIPSPVDIQAERDSVGNIAIKWKRRNRIGGDLVDGQDIPLGEDGEAYEIDVYNGGSVVRTIRAEAAGGGPLAMPEITYTADEQITDFTVVQSSLDVKVYQIGKVGRGREAAATV